MIKRLFIALSIGSLFAANPVHAESFWGPAPKVRGDYLVCPDGGALRSSDSRHYLDAAEYVSASNVRKRFQVQNAFTDVRFLPGKKSYGSYSKKEYNALIENLKWNYIATPESYVGVANGWYEPFGEPHHSKVILENSKQERITMLLSPGADYSRRNKIIAGDSEFEIDRHDLHYDFSPTSIISCPPESSMPPNPTKGKKYMLLRMIMPMSLKTKNQYGETTTSAMHVLIVNAWVEKVYLEGGND